jgi:hypothetical protein
MRQAGTTFPRNFAVFPAGEEMELDFEYFDERPTKAVLIVDYADLNGRPYSTRITIDDLPIFNNRGEVIERVVRMDRVEVFDKRELIPWKPPTTLRGRVEWWRAARRQRKEREGADNAP